MKANTSNVSQNNSNVSQNNIRSDKSNDSINSVVSKKATETTSLSSQQLAEKNAEISNEGSPNIGMSKLSVSNANKENKDAKLIANLKTKIREMELQNLTTENEKIALNETIASQSKTISGLNSQVRQLEEDIDKLKISFQQNASNVAIWKQQLQTFQEVNGQLSDKMSELENLYDKFGEILKHE